MTATEWEEINVKKLKTITNFDKQITRAVGLVVTSNAVKQQVTVLAYFDPN